MKIINNCFEKIITPKNLWRAWKVYRAGKRERLAVLDFEKNLEENLLKIYNDLKNDSYKHGGYYKFVVHDPKRRLISAPSIRDHIVHQAICNILIPYFEKKFSPFSFSCRNGRGTSGAIKKFKEHLRSASQNGCQDCWILHGDIEKCFDSIDHNILLIILKQRIYCYQTIKLLKQVIDSYDSGWRFNFNENEIKRGIPLGNLTSQLFINIYLNSLDQFVKEKLFVGKYVRYADDFLIVVNSKGQAEKIAVVIRNFLQKILNFNFPLSHQLIVSLRRGVEVLGIKFLPTYQKTRPSTWKRIFRKFIFKTKQYQQKTLNIEGLNAVWQSYRGLLSNGNNYKIKNKLLTIVNFYAR